MGEKVSPLTDQLDFQFYEFFWKKLGLPLSLRTGASSNWKPWIRHRNTHNCKVISVKLRIQPYKRKARL